MSGKPFKTYEEQIDKLQNEKGLIIPDTDEAIQILKKESYFALVNGYKDAFKRNDDKKRYRDTATFNDIYALYKFDESLRLLYLKYILVIERHVKSLMSYEFCSHFGDDQCEYFNATNYKYTSNSVMDVNRFLGVLANSYRKSREYKYIEHYSKNHKNVPLWVLMNVLTFGQVSKMFQYMVDTVQVAISKNFPELRQNELESMLSFITLFRNVCAHNERLFNYTVRQQTPHKYVHDYMNCKNNGSQDLFAMVICFKYLLNDKDFDCFVGEQQGVLAKYKPSSQTLSTPDLLKLMGFPPDWGRVRNAPKKKPLSHLDILGVAKI